VLIGKIDLPLNLVTCDEKMTMKSKTYLKSACDHGRGAELPRQLRRQTIKGE
jgi:hypothetical protein